MNLPACVRGAGGTVVAWTSGMPNAIRLCLTAALLAGCATDASIDELGLDPGLEQVDDGKADEIRTVSRDGDYRMELARIETTEDYGEWTVKPDLYLTAADSQSAACPDPSNCSFDLANGGLRLDTSERIWSGDELRDGVEFAVHDRYESSNGGGVIDEIVGLTKIRIGTTGTLRIKPFGRVKSVEFRVRF